MKDVMELIEKVRQTLTLYSMLSKGDIVLIGLSGGPDSVCLLAVLDNLRKDFNLLLNAVYIDHGLREGEVEDEIAFCGKLCDSRQIKFYSRRVDVKRYVKDKQLNLQEAARELRYEIYEDISNQINASKIAVGHNADDQAETVLMRLLRGSGKKGLTGIPPVRGKIIRPLIEVERGEIEKYLFNAGAVHELPLRSEKPFIVDSSNLKEDYFRNWLRLNLMKEIRKRNPSAVQDICRTADILRDEDDYLEIIVTKTLMRLISRKSDNSIELFLRPLEVMEKPVLRRVLRRAVNAIWGLRGIGFVHIEDIIRLIKEGRPGDRVHLPKNVRSIKEYSLLRITADSPVKISEYVLQPPCEIAIKETGRVIKASFEGKEGESYDGRTSVLLDAGIMDFPLKIRHRTEGDFFYPAGFGKRKKLQDFFVDEKIPRDERDRVPVVLSGSDIVWIAGYRADERYKVTDRTEKLLRLIITEVD
jgi:tRNA(Ile)-lysidine synthase